MHDTPGELAQATGASEWAVGQAAPEPGRTMPAITVVERDYPNLYAAFTALGPLMSTLGNGGKGIGWKTGEEIAELAELNGAVANRAPRRVARASQPTSTRPRRS